MKPWVIKIGGAALANPTSINELVKTVVHLKKMGEDVVVVHGGGPMINQKLLEKNISWSFFEGQRITSQEMIDCIADGLTEVNAQLTSALEAAGIQAQGVLGNREAIFISKPMNESLGLVGEVKNVNISSIRQLQIQGIVPVIAPMGVDENSQIYNINADWGAAKLAVALEARNLLFCTDQRGILDLNKLPYDSLNLTQLRILMKKEGVTGGMLAKARTIEYALTHDVEKVIVLHAQELCELVIDRNICGTFCVLMSRIEYITKMQELSHAY